MAAGKWKVYEFAKEYLADGTVSGTTLTYQTTNSDIDQAGLWKFQAYIEVGGLKGFGDITTQYFENSLLP